VLHTGAIPANEVRRIVLGRVDVLAFVEFSERSVRCVTPPARAFYLHGGGPGIH
jgi:hypothetical protein